MGAWYRRHLNQQSQDRFNPKDSNTMVAQITGVFVVAPGFPACNQPLNPLQRGIVIVPGTTVAATSAGFPLGFRPSDDPNGFGFQFFAGHRRSREPSILPNQPPVISSFSASTASITLPCAEGYHSKSNSCPASPSMSVGLTTAATDPDGDTLLYTYTVTGGRISGEGTNVSWDLSGVGPGTYTASVEVDDGCGCITSSTTTVTVANCSDCVPDLVCPTVTVDCPSEADDPGSVTFKAKFVQGTPTVSPTYNWSVSAGTITAGQGTDTITVDTTGKGG